MGKNIFFVDICNTLADVNRQLEVITGTKRPRGLYFHPSVCPEWFMEHLEVFSDCDVIPGAVEKLCALAQNNEIVYLTARPWSAMAKTVEWLKRKGFPSAPLLMTDDKVSAAKAYLAKKEREEESFENVFFLEDAPHEIVKLVREGFMVYVCEQDYNTSFANTFKWEVLEEVLA